MENDHYRYMRIALEEAKNALDAGEFPVGCVIVLDGEIVATGGRQNSKIEFSEIDHAEIVAIRNLQRLRPDIDRSRVTLYTTMEPCLMCYSTLLVNNVTKVVYGFEDVMGGGTNLPLKVLNPLYSKLDVEVVPGIMREECLALFKTFFSSETNTYLKGTLLAEYTLKQA